MKRFALNMMTSRMRSLLCAVVLTVAGFGMAGLSAQASDCCPAYRYERVLCYETRQVSYTVCETYFDHCGQPYQVQVVRYRTERVPVWRVVRVPCDS